MLPDEYTGESLCDYRLDKDFLDTTSKAPTTHKNIHNLDFTMKNFCSPKAFVKEIKDQPGVGKKHLQNSYLMKGLYQEYRYVLKT